MNCFWSPHVMSMFFSSRANLLLLFRIFWWARKTTSTCIASQNPRMVWFWSTLCLTGPSPTAAGISKCSLNGRHWMPPELWKPIFQSIRNTMDVLHLNETLPISPQKKGLIPPVVQLYTKRFFGLENRKKYYFEMWRKTQFPRKGLKKINQFQENSQFNTKVCIFWCGTKHGSHWFYFFLPISFSSSSQELIKPFSWPKPALPRVSSDDINTPFFLLYAWKLQF